MNVSNRTIWQLAGGPSTRPYADVFLRYGVGLIGPGDAGVWKPGCDDNEFEGRFVRHFANEMKVGDIVLLRTGIATITAIGLVASDYLHLNQFDDVNGWDLQHARRIRWCKLPQEHTFNSSIFGANPPRLSRSNKNEIRDFAGKFVNSPPTRWQEMPLPDLPLEEPELNIIPTHLKEIIAQAHDLHGIYWDRNKAEHPTEGELVAHFVVPFFRCLGWPPELIAVKWRYIDVAIFTSLPRNPQNCRFVIEAKRLGAGVEVALKQAKEYVKSLDSSMDIIVTDGLRYRLYSGEKDYKPITYANLIRLKQSATKFFDQLKRL